MKPKSGSSSTPRKTGADPAAQTPQPPSITDEGLLRRVRDGHSDAGDELVRRYCQPLLRYLHRLVGSEHLAEELHQQTWISVLDNIDKFNANSTAGGFKAWLFRIATNKATDHWRSSAREKAAKHGMRLVIDDRAPDASQHLEAEDQLQALRSAVEQLPENQKQVVLLRYYTGMKFVEIAEMLGCPLNTALGRMHKAVLRLRQLLEEESRPQREEAKR